MKLIVIAMLGAILFNLFRALRTLTQPKANDNNTVRALSWRIGLSVVLFIALLAAGMSGLLPPHTL